MGNTELTILPYAVPQLNLWWVTLAPLFPLLAFAVLALLPRSLRNTLRFLPVVGLAASFIIAVAAAITIWPGGPINAAFYTLSWSLGTIGGLPLTISLAVDSLAVLMLLMVSFVGLCVQIYSLYYMKKDERIGWFFCIKSLFLAAMLGFVLSGGLLLQFALWEIMGVCSYALIGFWFREKAPRKASQKAFLVTRAGDVGFFVALSAVFVGAHSFEFDQIFASAPDWSPLILGAVVFGLIWAAIGKSAQFPLSAWLPDAMAGPTPGSALIHAATMVVAGVFMLIRMLPVLQLSPLAMNMILAVGVVTALYGGLLACFQKDLKKVLAFSTISQLGFLFAAIGVGSAFVAVFHLTTHAFFKALLFLAAGIIIHATGTQSMKEMGGLLRKMPITFAVFTIGAFALAGTIPLSGFFSKDELFKALLYHGHDTGQYLAFAGVIIVGLLTAFYVVKSWFTVFIAQPGAAAEKAHEGHPLELTPVIALAVPAALLGLAVIPFGSFLAYPATWPPLYMVGISTAVMLTGATAGYFAYRRSSLVVATVATSTAAETAQPVAKPAGLGALSHIINVAADRRFYLDDVYTYLIIKPYFVLSRALWRFDERIIDGAVNGTTWLYQQGCHVFDWIDHHLVDGMVNGISWLYISKTRAARWFDDRIVDGLVNAISWIYVLLTRLTRIFDVRIIDGLVNGLATLSLRIGWRLRSVQSGEVQWYQRLIVGAAILLLGAFVIFYVVLV